MPACPSPLRVAIVGSGPAGFYAAGQLLAHKDAEITVDVYDRLATPWGLVRAGVAPDHPKIKSVSRIFEKTAALPGFRLHGNVEVGVDVSHAELAERYHAVLYTIGSPTDRHLGIPGEELPGSHAATAFVAWYNGHPDFCEEVFDLQTERAVVVGAGNVALDVARMLALTAGELEPTDTADHAIAALRASAIREIVVLARRGPAQAAWTNPELRELVDLEAADIVADPAEAELDEHSRAFIEGGEADLTVRNNVELTRGYSERAPTGKPKRIVLRFLRSPVAILGEGRVEAIRVVRNELVESGGRLSARPTGEQETIETGLVLRSIGYQGTPVPGLPFDERRATLHNEGGRVTDPETGAPIPGVYTAGWIKRGPSGVIGTNKKCAQETVNLLLEDLHARRLPEASGDPDELLDSLRERGVQIVDHEGWKRIDDHERGLGEPQGRPRVKLVRREELLERAAMATTRGG
jgi:ferredoxin--NADP+ reductase